MAVRWPADFPEDCPPEEANPAGGVFYYVVKNDPPEPSDFISLYHRDRELAEKRVRRGASLCQTMGLSTYADENDAVRCAREFPKIGNRIARLTLEPDAGNVQYTPSGSFTSHHTWWLAEVYDPTEAGTVVIAL